MNALPLAGVEATVATNHGYRICIQTHRKRTLRTAVAPRQSVASVARSDRNRCVSGRAAFPNCLNTMYTLAVTVGRAGSIFGSGDRRAGTGGTGRVRQPAVQVVAGHAARDRGQGGAS